MSGQRVVILVTVVSSPSPTAASELYDRYLTSSSEAEASASLDELFSHWLIGWCRTSVDRNLSAYGLRDIDRVDLAADISAEVLLAIAERLSVSKAGAAEPVANLRAYLSSATRNACFARIRARCPQHVQLQNRIRYLLRSDGRFIAVESTDGEMLASLAQWGGRSTPVTCPEIQRSADGLDDALAGLLALAGGPVRLTDALRTLAAALGVADWASTVVDPDSIANADRLTDDLLVERETLGVLWAEVRELPPTQRTALLLNLRDSEGHGVIELLPATGLASFADLALMLSMTPPELAAVWNHLPLEDAKIADLLGLTRQQVINLRKAARDRLARRTRRNDGNIAGVSPSATGVGILGLARQAVGAIFGGARRAADKGAGRGRS